MEVGLTLAKKLLRLTDFGGVTMFASLRALTPDLRNL